MLLEVMINDKGPYKLIFDTGAPINLLNNRLAKDAGIIKKGGGGFSLFGGLNQIDVAKMQVGGITAEKLPAIVMDHPTVKAISDAFSDEYGPIEGIVGFPFFGRVTPDGNRWFGLMPLHCITNTTFLRATAFASPAACAASCPRMGVSSAAPVPDPASLSISRRVVSVFIGNLKEEIKRAADKRRERRSE